MTMQRLRTIFASFFKIGLFTFGGVFIASVKKVNPILLIALSAAAGILIYYVF